MWPGPTPWWRPPPASQRHGQLSLMPSAMANFLFILLLFSAYTQPTTAFEIFNCSVHKALYGQIYSDLRPYYGNKISFDMMTEAIQTFTMPKPGFAFMIFKGNLYSLVNLDETMRQFAPNIAREIKMHFEELRDLVDRYGAAELPDVEMVVMVDDVPIPEHRTFDIATKLRRNVTWAPVGHYFSTDGYSDYAVPGWGFKWNRFDDYVLPFIKNLANLTPWEKKQERLYGNYLQYSVCEEGRKDTGEGYSITDLRPYVTENVSRIMKDTMDISRDRLSDLREHSNHKYLAIIDGIGPTNRFLEQLGLGSLVFKQKSIFRLHFEGGLKAWEHYVPWWEETPWDADSLVRWARENDEEARRIAVKGRKFVLAHLHRDARLCYWRQLIRSYAQVLGYKPQLGMRPLFRPYTEVEPP
eukprot:jgi/Mesvir1/3654/Mv14947-RA.1